MASRRLVLFATTLALASAAAAPTADADDTSGTPIAYSATYLELIALFPAGYAPNGCELSVALSGGWGVCTTEFAPAYFYPDGTLGTTPWFVDPSSSTGWSVEPDPCATDPACLEGF